MKTFLRIIVALQLICASAFAAPNVSQWASNMLTYGSANCTRLSTLTPNDSRLRDSFYDAERVFYQIKDYTGDTSWNTCAGHAEFHYRDNYVITNNGGIPSYNNWSNGLLMDWQRNGDTTSKSAINSIATNATFCASTPYQDARLQHWLYARENAYCLMAHINNYLAGNGLNSSRISFLFENALTHITQWTTTQPAGNFSDDTRPFHIKPFMTSLTAEALIYYYDNINADSRILPAIKSIADYIWTNQWDSNIQAFQYIEPPFVNPNDADDNDSSPKPDLNLLIAPMYSWIAWRSVDSSYLSKFEQIFNSGVANAYLGGGKQFNENYKWSRIGLTYYDNANTLLTPPVSRPRGQGMMLLGVSAQPAATATAAPTPTNTPTPTATATPNGASYNPNSYFTGATQQFWFDWSDSTKVLKSGGTSAANGEKIDQVNAASGTPYWQQTTDASRGTVTTAAAGSRQGGTFTSGPFMTLQSGSGVIQNASKLTFGAVFKLNSASANAVLLRAYDNSYSYHRFRAFLTGANPSADGQKADSTNHTTVTATDALTVGAVHAVIWEWDVANGTITIYANGTTTSVSSAAFGGGAGTIANTTSPEIRTGLSGDVTILDQFLYTGALMTAGQRASWFADVAARFNSSYNPADYYSGGTLQYWTDWSDSSKVLNGSGTSATNTQTIDRVNSSGTPYFQQTTDANRPVCSTNVANSRQGGTITSTKFMTLQSGSSVLQNTNKVSFGAVFKLVGTGANAVLLRAYDNSYSYHRFRAFLTGANPSADGQKADSTNHTNVSSSTALSTGTIHAVLWEWDVAAGTITIYADNATTNISGSAFGGGAGTIANTTSPEIRTGLTSDIVMLDQFLYTGGLNTNRAAWFAAVKAKFGITVY